MGRGRDRWRWIALYAGGLLLLGLCWSLGYSRVEEGRTESVRIGAGFGSALLPLALTLVVRGAYLKFKDRPLHLFTPGVLFAAGLVALFLAAARADSDDEAASDNDLEAVSLCASIDPFFGIKAPLKRGPMPPRLLERVTARMSNQRFVREIQGAVVSLNGRPVAHLVSFPIGGGEDESRDFLLGYASGLPGDEEPIPLEIGGHRALRYDLPNETQLTGNGFCHGITVTALTPGIAQLIGESLFRR